GKSTLFNRLVGERRAIVLDTPGVTRDRHYGDAVWAERMFTVIDTGGFEPEATQGVVASMRQQALMAIDEAQVVVFVTDGREGLVTADHDVAEILRRRKDRVLLAVNKIDGKSQLGYASEFYAVGIPEVFPISAEHGRGVNRLLDAVVALLPEPQEDEDAEDEAVTRIALIGRPNVGKSTLANRLLGEERVIVDNVAGTTRDAIDLPLTGPDGQEYLLIDTAGLRRRRGISRGSAEGFSVMRTLKAIERCHVAVMLIDATEGLTDQDARILGVAVDRGRGVVLVVNKWDAVEKDHRTAQLVEADLRLKLPFATFAPVLFLSGLTGQRVHKLLSLVEKVRQSHLQRIATGPLNRWLELATQKHHPPIHKNRRLKLYYATQVRNAPPTIVVSVNDAEAVHFSYERFLLNQLREAFDFEGTPIKLVFKGKGPNPFDPDDE
ncbi:MAG: ribosome biogenesis GTPase Der, partial [Myxococcales bacterium]|nr:ribosome biogenesis GTPase Der [Myxococcales bacterium]